MKVSRPITSWKADYAPVQVQMDNSPVSNLSRMQNRRTETDTSEKMARGHKYQWENASIWV